MIHWRSAVVAEVLRSWPGATEYAARLDDRVETVRALGYTDVVGTLSPGDRVLLSCSALLRGLGTGGMALVVAAPDRLPADPPPGPGHIVKARYTPLQQMVLAVDEQEAETHERMREADSLEGMPVVAADLHSALPAIVAGVRVERPDARIAYVWTDGAALPAVFSRALAGLREAGWVASCITAGQAYGGDLEAVTVHTALLAARHVVGADVTVVAQGPGNAGTGTPWGFSGVAAGEALNAADVLGGRAVAALRVSEADPRERHRGLSHHSATAYGRVFAGRGAAVALESRTELDREVLAQARAMAGRARGELRVETVSDDGLMAALRGCPVPLSTMGRGLEQDAAAFRYSAAAGRYAARLLEEPVGG